MVELQPEYLNKIANQLIVICSLLGGFSITVLANILVTKSESRIINYILKVTTIAAACFLVTVFAMTQIVMMTTEGYPLAIDQDELDFAKILGFSTFFLGIISLSLLIVLSGWTQSKRTGIFTTIIGFVMLVLLLMNL